MAANCWHVFLRLKPSGNGVVGIQITTVLAMTGAIAAIAAAALGR